MTRDEMIEYLEARGWEHYPSDVYQEEGWLLPGRIQFEGDDSTERAFAWQLTEQAKPKESS